MQILPFTNHALLVSFDTILDLDTGLVELIRKEYADPNIFDIELLKLPDVVLYSNLYYRPYKNPLYTIRNRNMKLTKENVQLLDDYYIEFMQEEYDNILRLSKRTDIDELVSTFNSSKDVVVHIMVETDREAEQIKTIDIISGIPIVYKANIGINNSFNQVYLKYFSDYEKLPETICNTTFYISDCGVNLNVDDNKPRKECTKSFLNIIDNRNEIAIYNMYKQNIINKGYLDYFKNIINYDMITEE